MLRRLLPLVVGFPGLLTWLCINGARKGLYMPEVGVLLFATVLTLVLTGVILWNARALNQSDSERQRVEAALRHSRDQWELTFNCMSEGLSYHDPEYNLVGANEAFYRMLGRETLSGCKCYEVVHQTTEPPDYCPMRRTLVSKQTESGEFFEPRLRRYLSVRTDPVRDGNGNIVRVVHVVNDITERKQAEDAVRRLAAVVESSHDAIIGKDLQGRIVSWNHGAEKIYGYTAAEVLGKPVTILCPSGTENDEDELLTYIHAGQRIESLERLRVRRDGVRIYISATISPILGPDGKIVGVSTIDRDISDRKRAEQERSGLLRREQQVRRELEAKTREIEKLNADLERRVRLRTIELEVANKELEAFSYSVSHDLRAPLRSIDGFSQILLDEYGDKFADEGRDFLRRVRAASQHMGQLIDSLLQLSRMSRFEMRCGLVNISAMAREVATELQNTNADRQVEWVITDALLAQADPKLLHIAMQNLLSNAWKFTSKMAAAKIEVGKVEQDGDVVYFVRDNGAGFDMAYANKLFGAFQRLHSTSEFEGSGIGLATVQRIIHRHGGRVWADSAPGRGATFYFTLTVGERF
ncbi:MAG: PAS domain S-box protein [Terriglobales bacterium]